MLKFAHGSREGNGALLEVDIESRSSEYAVIMKISRQTNNGDAENATGGRWQFNDPCPALVALNAQQVSRIISVLEGTNTRISPRKDGMSVDAPGVNGVMFLEMITQPYDGYNLHIKQEWCNGERANARILLNINEAICLRLALRSVMDRLAFGNTHK